jgi:hypothetical protein
MMSGAVGGCGESSIQTGELLFIGTMTNPTE